MLCLELKPWELLMMFSRTTCQNQTLFANCVLVGNGIGVLLVIIAEA